MVSDTGKTGGASSARSKAAKTAIAAGAAKAIVRKGDIGKGKKKILAAGNGHEKANGHKKTAVLRAGKNGHAAKNGHDDQSGVVKRALKDGNSPPTRKATRHATMPPPASRALQTAIGSRLTPVKARPSKTERAFAESRAHDVDEVCAAWAAIIAERMAADQQFAETFELFENRPRDLRGLFMWDALHAAEAHVALLNAVIAKHLDGNRADPLAILGDLRREQHQTAIVYAVNAFMAVLNQMSPNKPKWVMLEDLDPRMAVLALAHQTLEYALQAARIVAPTDLTEHILSAASDESVWTGARDARDRTLAACAATAAFFRSLGIEDLASIDEIITLYETRVRESSPPSR